MIIVSVGFTGKENEVDVLLIDGRRMKFSAKKEVFDFRTKSIGDIDKWIQENYRDIIEDRS